MHFSKASQNKSSERVYFNNGEAKEISELNKSKIQTNRSML